MWIRAFPLFALTCLATSQDLGPLELDPDLDTITERLGLEGRDDAAIETHWTQGDWQKVIGFADTRIQTVKGDFRGYALKYLAYLELKKDRAEATQFAVRTLRDLARHPIQMARFIRRALFATPTRNEYQIALMALVPAVPDHPKNHDVRLAHLQALFGCGKAKEAVVTNQKILEDLGNDAPALLELAHTICDAKDGRGMAIIAKQALDTAVEEQGENAANRLAKYRVLLLQGEKEAAKKLGKSIVAQVDASDLNNWTWYLMTRRSTAGRYPTLALLSAHRMEQLTDLGFHEYDTIGLALFRNRQFAEALEYQKKALQAGGSTDADYRRRLKKYERVLAEHEALKKKRAQDKK